MSKPVVLRDVADYCGVNVTTVSRALRRDKRISSATTERVLAVAKQLGYDPARFHAARQLRLSRHGQHLLNNTIAFWFVHKGFSNSNYFARLQEGLFNAITERQFEMYTSEPYFFELRGELPTAYRRGDIDGALSAIQNVEWLNRAIEILREEPNFGDRPIVSIVEPVPDTSSVHPDNEAAGFLAMSHLLEMGHRHMLSFYFASDGSPSVISRRFEGFLRAIDAHGLAASDVTFVPGGIWHGVDDLDARDAKFVELLRSHPEVTAIVAQNDRHAVEICATLQKYGMNVPDDVSMISFDDTDPIFQGSENMLTTVRLPLTECGQVGTDLLIRQIMGKEPLNQEIVLPVELLVRGSVLPAK